MYFSRGSWLIQNHYRYFLTDLISNKIEHLLFLSLQWCHFNLFHWDRLYGFHWHRDIIDQFLTLFIQHSESKILLIEIMYFKIFLIPYLFVYKMHSCLTFTPKYTHIRKKLLANIQKWIFLCKGEKHISMNNRYNLLSVNQSGIKRGILLLIKLFIQLLWRIVSSTFCAKKYGKNITAYV